ncbi:MAG: carboxypeptidase regulatory-like domain-containing protein [Deltaproteobacteria bacterium]|nr:carboxypeptidase regulatory-like domain-containing protein [Deltaproteobacteria bacterium]
MARGLFFACVCLAACAPGGLQSESLGNNTLGFETAAALTGKLKDAATGDAIGGASVKLGAATASSGSDGAFSLRGLLLGKQPLIVRADGYEGLSIDVEVSLGNTDVGVLELTAVAATQSCEQGFDSCGGACVDTSTDDKHCGGCGKKCTATEVCEAGACAALPFNCNTDGCPDNSYCDTGSNQCFSGCLASDDCGGGKVCNTAAKTCACAATDHTCLGQCVANNDPQTCGNQCTPCLAPANGTPTCDGSKCGYACNNGYTKCSDGCCLPFENVKTLSATGYHASCAVKLATNETYCWGANDHSALGDGTNQSIRNVPTRVDGLGTTAVLVSPGYMFGCAIVTGGAVKCWGRGQYGQLGDGGGASNPAIVDVYGLQSGVTHLSAGGLHACAVVAGGQVRCWGGDNDGELGNGASGTYATMPVTVCTNKTTCGALTGIKEVSAGTSVTCALSTTGTVYCWGSNLYGRLGNGIGASDTSVATLVGGLSGIKKVVLGDSHACVITASDGLKCWGFGGHGEIGDGFKQTRYTPTDVSGLSSGVLDVSIGDSHACVLMTGGGVKCWGDNRKAQIGDGTIDERLTPTPVVGLAFPAIGIAVGDEHSCAVLNNRRVQCWGNNEFGTLGDSTNANVKAAPVYVLQAH